MVTRVEESSPMKRGLKCARNVRISFRILVEESSPMKRGLKYNSRLTLKTTRARFWLDLRDRFSRFDEVHLKLRTLGTWTGGAGPETAEEWTQVEAYMALFEHCELMLRDGLLDEPTFRKIYRYRVENLLANRRIVQTTLIEFGDSWTDFLNLVERFGLSDRVRSNKALQPPAPEHVARGS